MRRVILSLSAGFALAVLIAWGCLIAARMPLRSHVELLDPARDPVRTMHTSHGRLTRAPFAGKAAIYESRPPLAGTGLYMPVWRHNAPQCDTLPGWVARAPPQASDTPYWNGVSTTWCGFPFAMFRSTRGTYDRGGPTRRYNGQASPPLAPTSAFRCPCRFESFVPASGLQEEQRIVTWGAIDLGALPAWMYHKTAQRIALPDHLPLSPIWSGLLANTASYAGLIWLVFFLPAVLRTRIHRWRHPNAIPCKHCRYDLAGIEQPVCPECGQAVPSLQTNPKSERRATP
ncbi:MAG: hypothetical protein ACTS3F_07815 [Phycisphaerales bacterium]